MHQFFTQLFTYYLFPSKYAALPTITLKELKEWINKGSAPQRDIHPKRINDRKVFSQPLLIDCRTSEEFRVSHIPGAILVSDVESLTRHETTDNDATKDMVLMHGKPLLYSLPIFSKGPY